MRVGLRVGYKGVSITIEDNGWGLREKFSADSGTANELTLREMQGMVSFWGGRLEVLSRLGVGSRMCVELVRVDAFATDSDLVNEERKVVDELQQANTTSRPTI